MCFKHLPELNLNGLLVQSCQNVAGSGEMTGSTQTKIRMHPHKTQPAVILQIAHIQGSLEIQVNKCMRGDHVTGWE